MSNALWLGGWRVLSMDPSDRADEIEIMATLAEGACGCLKCGAPGERLYRHGVKVLSFRDLPAYGMKIVLKARIPRYKCRECRATFMQRVPDMDDAHRMTSRCRAWIAAQPDTVESDWISGWIGVNERTIRRIRAEARRPAPVADETS